MSFPRYVLGLILAFSAGVAIASAPDGVSPIVSMFFALMAGGLYKEGVKP